MKKLNQKVLLYVLLGILAVALIGVAIYYGSGSTMQGSLQNVMKDQKKFEQIDKRFKDTTIAPVNMNPTDNVVSVGEKRFKDAATVITPGSDINTTLAPVNAAPGAPVQIDLPAGMIKSPTTTTSTTGKD